MTSHVLIRQAIVVARNSDDGDVPWWSFTKTVIAAAALALVRDDQLVLDEPLANRPYTLRQLLQHRAGLTEYGRLSRIAGQAVAAGSHAPAAPVDR